VAIGTGGKRVTAEGNYI